MAKRLEKELERGKAQFRVSGIVTVKDNTFPEKDEDGNLKETVSEKTGFSYMRAGFFIKANESQSAFNQKRTLYTRLTLIPTKQLRLSGTYETIKKF